MSDLIKIMLQAEVDPSSINKIKTQINGIQKNTKFNVNTTGSVKSVKDLGYAFDGASASAGVLSKAVENAGKFLRFYLVGGVLVGFVRSIKNGVDSVVELDTSLTELAKVSDMTATQLAEFTDKAYELGRTIGRTGKEVIDATATFKRAGYEIQQSFELSEQALLLTNVGDGINDVTEASSSLIAILKGFKMEAEETSHIVDALNETSNNYAVDTNNLTEILKRTSGTLGQTGTSFEELLGLSTAGFESLRSASQVASGINMIAQRLKGMTAEGEKVDDLIPKIQSAFEKYTNGTVSVIDKHNGGLHSTYEILEQLSKVYPTLSDEAKAYLNEAIAGNRQNKVLVAIMDNWNNVENSIISAKNSLGSANEENEKYLNSIEGRLAQLESRGQIFWKNFIDSDSVKSFIDILINLVEVMDKLVNNQFTQFVLKMVAITTSVALAQKGLGMFKNNLIENAIGVFILDIINATKSTASFTTALKGASATMMASPLFKVTLAIAAIGGIIKLVDTLTVSLEEQQEAVATLASEINSLQSEYDKLRNQENKTDEQIKYLALLNEEIKAKKESRIEDEKALVQRKYLDYTGSQYNPTNEITETERALYKLEKQQLKMNEALDNQDYETYKDLRNQVSETELALIETYKDLKEHQEILGDEMPAALVELMSKIENLIVDEENLKEIIDDINDSANEQVKTLSELTEEFEKVTSEIQEYYKILDELNSKEGLSAKSKQDIITKHQQLLPYINDEKELRKQLIQIIADEEKTQQQAYKNMITISEDFFNAKIKGNDTLVKTLGEFYTKDLDNAKSLADAKRIVEESLVKDLSGLWARYYNVASSNQLAEADYRKKLAYGFGSAEEQEAMRAAINAIDQQKEVAKRFEELTNGFVNEMNFKDINLPGSKTSKSSKEYKAEADAYERINLLLDKNNILLQKNKTLQNLASDDTEEKIRLMNEEISLMEDRQSKLHELNNLRREERDRLEKALTEQDFVFEGSGDDRMIANLDNINGKTKEVEETFKRYIQIQKDEIPQAGQEWWKLKDSIQGVIDTQYELARQDWIKSQNKLYEDQQDKLKSLEQIQEKIVAIIRKRGEEEKKALDESHRAEMESLEERHRDRKEKYADELDTFRKLIQGKIDALDDQYEEEDYLEQLNKEREEANRLQGEIDVLSLDDSLTARNKTIELRKQLADQNDKITKMQQKKERDTLRKSLQDQLKDKENDVKEKEKLADDLYENEKKRLEEDYRINKEFLDLKYSDEKVYAEARKSIMRGQVEVAEGVFMDIYDAFEDFEDKFGKGMGILGDIIKNDFIRQLEDARRAIENLDYKSNNRLPQYHSDYDPGDDVIGWREPVREPVIESSRPTETSKPKTIKEYSDAYFKARDDGDWRAMEYANRQANILRGLGDVVTSQVDIDSIKKKYGTYKQGGETERTGLHWLDGRDNEPERILSTQQTKDFNKLVDITPEILKTFDSSNIKDIIKATNFPTVNVSVPKVPTNTLSKGVTLQIDNFIKADNITKDSIPELRKVQANAMEDLKILLNKNGVRPSLI